MTVAAADLTLDEMRATLAPPIAANAAFDGWGETALAAAAGEAGIDPGHARLAFPGGGPDMIDAWFAEADKAMAARLPPDAVAAMKVRARIRAAVLARLEATRGEREALRRALAVLAQPANLTLGARLAWRAADAMWRLAGDTATDLNHYTKRAILSGVYGATVLVFLDDASDGLADTRAFLDRRIDGIMRFEQAKARLRLDPDRMFDPVRFLGRLRYPG